MKSANLKYPPPLPSRPAFVVVDHPSSPVGPTATQRLHNRLVCQSSALHRFRALHGQRSLGSARASSHHVPRDLSAIGGFRKMGSPQNEWGKDISAFMQLALDQVKLRCVIVEEGKVIASGRNLTNETRNATRHAEMEAIDTLLERWQQQGSFTAEVAEKFLKCSLFVTCEPCIMCAAALSITGIKEVYFGCANVKFGACGSILSLHLNDTGPSVSAKASQTAIFSGLLITLHGSGLYSAFLRRSGLIVGHVVQSLPFHQIPQGLRRLDIGLETISVVQRKKKFYASIFDIWTSIRFGHRRRQGGRRWP